MSKPNFTHSHRTANGVHDVTTSTDPTTAALIQKHVVEMYERLDQNRKFPYPVCDYAVNDVAGRNLNLPISWQTTYRGFHEI